MHASLPSLFALILGSSIVSLWGSSKRIWGLSLWAIGLGIAFYLKFIDVWGGMALLGMGVIIYAHYHWISEGLLHELLALLILVGGMGLFLHWVPGFHNWLMVDHLIFSPDCIAYRFYLNLDKISVAFFLLAFGIPLSHKGKDWIKSIKGALLPSVIAVVILCVLSISVGYVRFDFKFPAYTWTWILTNLLFVAVVEEAFFRGFLQQKFTSAFKQIPSGSALAIIIAALFFGWIHYRGGLVYITLSSIAGCIYGYAYKSSNRLESAVLTHFGLNLVHFLFFSYPALK